MIFTFLKTMIVSCFLSGGAFAFKVGVTAGPHAMIMEKVKEKAVKEGFDIQVVEFNDFILPNEALNEGELGANSYQHQPFLEEQIRVKGYKMAVVAKTVLMPMGLYSTKIKALSELKEGAALAIPNDPTNGGRALTLLQKNGLITLKEGVALPSLLDVVENPKKLKIVELEAPQVMRTLQDVEAVISNTDWVFLIGMDPKTALVMEEAEDNPYVNLIVVQSAKKEDEDVKKFVRLYQSPDIKAYIEQEFKGAVKSAW